MNVPFRTLHLSTRKVIPLWNRNTPRRVLNHGILSRVGPASPDRADLVGSSTLVLTVQQTDFLPKSQSSIPRKWRGRALELYSRRDEIQGFIAGVSALWFYDYFLTLSDEASVSFA